MTADYVEKIRSVLFPFISLSLDLYVLVVKGSCIHNLFSSFCSHSSVVVTEYINEKKNYRLHGVIFYFIFHLISTFCHFSDSYIHSPLFIILCPFQRMYVVATEKYMQKKKEKRTAYVGKKIIEVLFLLFDFRLICRRLSESLCSERKNV